MKLPGRLPASAGMNKPARGRFEKRHLDHVANPERQRRRASPSGTESSGERLLLLLREIGQDPGREVEQAHS